MRISFAFSSNQEVMQSFIAPLPDEHDVVNPHTNCPCIIIYHELFWQRTFMHGTKQQEKGLIVPKSCEGGEHEIDYRRRQNQALYRELKAYENAGLKLWINGRPGHPGYIAKQCMIRENMEYMKDFVRDEKDQIIGIGIDFVKNN